MKKAPAWFGLIARIILGTVIFLAGYLKVGNTAKSQMAVRAYEILPISVANFFGLLLPFLEVAVGLLLLVGAAIRVNAAIAGVLMLLFIAAITQAGLRGLSIDCGCFGGGGAVEPGKTQYLAEIARDTGLFLLALYLYRYPSSKFSLDKPRKQES